MNDDPDTSGNRWEPAPGSYNPTDAPAGEMTDPTQPIKQPAQRAAAAQGRRPRAVRRAGLAGAVAALFLGGGAGGYALAHVSGDDGFAPAGFRDGVQGPDDHER